MRTVSVNLPDFVDIDANELKFILASRLYGSRKLSLGQAAEVVGVSKRSFIELLGYYGVSVFNYDIDELEDDLHNA
jgi:predicted HTH domain antitoxin